MAIGFALAPGCRSSAGGDAAVHVAPRSVEARGLDDAGGAGGSATDGGAPPTPSPTQPVPGAAGEGGDATGAGGASEPSIANNAGDTGAAGAPTVIVAPRPSCGKQQDGTLCGANMVPAGADGVRYFCSDGELLAEARCPGACNVETNACEQSGGTGSGSGETGLHVALRCPNCYDTICRAELTACRGNPLCLAHLSCVESCSLERECFAICESVFAGEPLFGDLDECAEQTGCAASCRTEGQP